MEANSRIFCDSNYFVSLFNPEDGLNEQAVTLAERIRSHNVSLVISNFIFAEVVTVLSQKYQRHAGEPDRSQPK